MAKKTRQERYIQAVAKYGIWRDAISLELVDGEIVAHKLGYPILTNRMVIEKMLDEEEKITRPERFLRWACRFIKTVANRTKSS